MNHVIWKYTISANAEFVRQIPKGAVVLAVQLQGSNPCMWLRVDPDAETERRRFYVRATGHPLGDAATATYVGTFQHGNGLVFHLFDGGLA